MCVATPQTMWLDAKAQVYSRGIGKAVSQQQIF